MRNFLLAIIGISIGVSSGFFVMSESAPAPLRKTFHPEKKMEIMGFQPFWLLDAADTNYNSYTTTITYFGLQIDEEGHIRKLNNEVEQEPGWANLQSSKVKTLLDKSKTAGVALSIAVQSADEETISLMMENPETSANNLVNDMTPIMKEYGFTDLNLDIESFRNVSNAEQAAFTLFVKEVRAFMKTNDLGTLSIDITPMALIQPRLTSVSDIDQYTDRIILMAYDYHYAGSALAGPVAPLSGAGVVREYDVESAIQVLLKQTSPEKILLGLPAYGYEWETLSANPFAPSIPGTGKNIPAKQVDEVLRACADCKTGRDELSKQPYAIKQENGYYRQIYYVDGESVKESLETAKHYNLKGVAVWAYGYETNAIKDELSIYR